MRGRDDRADGLFSYVRLEERIPADHPLRAVRRLADEALAALNGRFEALYSSMGRPSIAPEMLLRATLLQAFFSVRSERMLMEQINYNLLFRWFVGLPLDGAVWHATVFTHNRDRLLEAEVAREFLSALLSLPRVKTLLSDDQPSSSPDFRSRRGDTVVPGEESRAKRRAAARATSLRERRLQTPDSRRSILGRMSFALRSLCAVIPDPLEGALRRLDGTADRCGHSRTDDNPSRTARRVQSVPRVD